LEDRPRSGRLLAEYNLLGQLVRDYIYFGGQLVAEYRAGAFYYYASDQINSTRIVTDSDGTVVYSAVHEPYGGIQKTWTSTYDPSLKFSGKERDEESELDYFGARYYDRAQYRFMSVDPVIPAGKAVANPQRWNLYAYCLGNPVSYVDTTGADTQKIIIEIIRYQEGSGICTGKLLVNGTELCWTLENSIWKLPPGTYGADLTNEKGQDVIKLRNARKYVYDPTTGKTTAYEAAIKPGLRSCQLMFATSGPS
jgi:RHS repeat-associated protein